MTVRSRTLVADYLNVDGNFELMGAGFTQIDENTNAKTTSKKYVNDKTSTNSIISYETSFGFETDQIRSEKAVEFLCNVGEMHKIGSDAETEYIRVDLDKPSSTDGSYRARKFNVAIEVDDLSAKDGEMSAKGKLLCKGDFVLGTFDTSSKKFTEGFAEKTVSTNTLSE